MKYIFLILSCFSSLTAFPQTFPKVDAALKRYDVAVAKSHSEFSKLHADPNDTHWVVLKIAHMVYVDQYMRGFITVPKSESWSKDEVSYFWKEFLPRWRSVDERNTAELKSLLTIYPWITVSKFGNASDENAWLLVQHADHDLPFQKSVLAILKKLYPIDETRPKNYAMLYDRVSVNSKQPFQRYGSQGTCKGNSWEPYPIEEFSGLDQRRAEMGMETFVKNKARLDKICATFPSD